MQQFIDWYKAASEPVRDFVDVVLGGVLVLLGVAVFPFGAVLLIPGIIVVVIFGSRFIKYLMSQLH